MSASLSMTFVQTGTSAWAARLVPGGAVVGEIDQMGQDGYVVSVEGVSADFSSLSGAEGFLDAASASVGGATASDAPTPTRGTTVDVAA